MDVNDYVFVINPADRYYGRKYVIRGVQTDFDRRITGYTVRAYPLQEQNGRYRDYLPTDLQYTTASGQTFTSQMQLL
jgi:hypothetical protein